MDWRSIQHALASAVTVTATRPRGFSATTTNRDRIVVERAPGDRVDWLVVRVHVCAQHELDPALVLERNGRLAFATLLLAQDAYWVRVAVPFDSAELHDPVRLLALCVDAARSLAPNQLHALPPSALFSHYTE